MWCKLSQQFKLTEISKFRKTINVWTVRTISMRWISQSIHSWLMYKLNLLKTAGFYDTYLVGLPITYQFKIKIICYLT